MEGLANKARNIFFIAGLWGSSLIAGVANAKQTQINAEYFDIRAEPSKADWRFFLRSTEQSRLTLWQKHLSRGKHLKDWHWGWRLGWIRSCATSKHPVCTQLLVEALFDRALVVRAEAASRLGNLYAGSADNKIMMLLERAFINKANLRGGHPLFVQQRILYAMHLVGNSNQKARAMQLAELYPATKDYWRRLVAAADFDK